MLRQLNLKLFLLLFIFCQILAAKDIQKADSLFVNQKYTEAFEQFEQIFQDGSASPSMLLKMAFIKDGLGDYPKALYYLDLYYKKTADRSVLGKIEELSNSNELQGYQYTDVHFFSALFDKNKTIVQLVVGLILMSMFAYTYTKKRQNERPVAVLILSAIIGLFLMIISNTSWDGRKAIIETDNTLLRSGPSAGAEPVEMVGKGHKVDVLQELPGWTKIVWEGKSVYVRNGKISII